MNVLLLFGLLILYIQGASSRSDDAKQRIIGGGETSIDRFPYIVSYRFYNDHRCGGIIYSFRIVLVAASCVLGLDPGYMTVVGGITNRHDSGVELTVKEVLMHENYDAWANDYDIALLLLTKPFSFNQTIQAIDLASAGEEVRSGTRAYIAGWGRPIEEGYTQDMLHSLDLYVISREDCADKFDPYYEITDGMICAEKEFSVRGVCYGDFGGPLVIGGRLFGITSFSIGCGEKEYPPVFTKVSRLNKWIKEEAEKLLLL